MKSLRGLMEPFLEKHNIQPPRDFSPEDRLNLLEISPERRVEIEGFEFTRISKRSTLPVYREIEMRQLRGVNRTGKATNWMEQLYALHRQRNFEIYRGREQFERFLKSCDSSREDLPHVVDVNGAYYIDTSGMHRLTFAKCLGIERVPVLVSSAD